MLVAYTEEALLEVAKFLLIIAKKSQSGCFTPYIFHTSDKFHIYCYSSRPKAYLEVICLTGKHTFPKHHS